jgi:hypothetical protein
MAANLLKVLAWFWHLGRYTRFTARVQRRKTETGKEKQRNNRKKKNENKKKLKKFKKVSSATMAKQWPKP